MIKTKINSFFSTVKTNYIDILLSIGAGLLLFFSTAGLDIWIFAFIAFALIGTVFIRGKIPPEIASYLMGFTFYFLGMRWVTVPMTDFGGAPIAASYVLVLFIGLLGGFFFVPLGYISKKYRSALLAALVFIAMEMVKGSLLFGGMPWLNVAQTQYNNIIALQIISFGGEYLLSFLVVLIGLYAAELIKIRNKYAALRFLAPLVLLVGFGLINLSIHREPVSTAVIRVVQTGVDQADKWAVDKIATVRNQISRSLIQAYADKNSYDMMLLPETTYNVPIYLDNSSAAVLRHITTLHPAILGFDRVDMIDNKRHYYNSAGLMDNGTFLQIYDKRKLAPFGEYFPLEKLLYPLRKFFFGDAPFFTPGHKSVVIKYGDIRVAPLICFESAFSILLRQEINDGANLIAVLSNDAWFGKSIGRTQHFAIDVVRAVEYHRDLIRATQDGVTAHVAASGKIMEKFPEKQFHYEDIKVSLHEGRTLYARFGYVWYVVLLAAVLALRYRKKIKQSTKKD